MAPKTKMLSRDTATKMPVHELPGEDPGCQVREVVQNQDLTTRNILTFPCYMPFGAGWAWGPAGTVDLAC